MHGADYDLRLLFKHHAFTPGSIFDTMLAARLLGHRQFGLSSLVETILGVKLDKGPQKADWARRPLTERMENYARNDTVHLKPLANRLMAELTEKHRLDWHRETCGRLIADCSQPAPDDSDTAWRIKGSHVLNRAGLGVLRELWQWREDEAIAADRPPFFILAHDKLVAMAESAVSKDSVERHFPRHLSPRRREGIAKAIRAALIRSADTHPEILRNRTRRPSEAERRRYHELEQRRDGVAASSGFGRDAHCQPLHPWRTGARLGQTRAGIDALAAAVVAGVMPQVAAEVTRRASARNPPPHVGGYDCFFRTIRGTSNTTVTATHAQPNQSPCSL